MRMNAQEPVLSAYIASISYGQAFHFKWGGSS
jgi:hypothetical protein